MTKSDLFIDLFLNYCVVYSMYIHTYFCDLLGIIPCVRLVWGFVAALVTSYYYITVTNSKFPCPSLKFNREHYCIL